MSNPLVENLRTPLASMFCRISWCCPCHCQICTHWEQPIEYHSESQSSKQAYSSESDAACIYWNLDGHNNGDILSNVVQICGSQITLVNSDLAPTGKFGPLKGTPYDFLEPQLIKSKINGLANGYDMNYVLDGGVGHKLKKAAVVHDLKLGRVLELSTTPGMQFYTSNTLDIKGKGGFEYKPHATLCLETQAFPDSVNHSNFPYTIVSPGKPYKHYMPFKFSTN